MRRASRQSGGESRQEIAKRSARRNDEQQCAQRAPSGGDASVEDIVVETEGTPGVPVERRWITVATDGPGEWGQRIDRVGSGEQLGCGT
ncbi:MAG: hypothetical protein JWM41_96 [Gemmatimonadetes bacterium]|nr:hypothetical protein [Gemmatimonadota bacterium]